MGLPASITRSNGPHAVEATGERPLRVALVIYALHLGGAQRALSALARHWSQAGSDVTVVTLDGSDTDVFRLDPGVRRVSLDLLQRSRNPVEALYRGSRRVAALRRALVEFQPDAVVSFLTSTNVLSILACLGTGLPVLACERTDPRLLWPGAPWAALRRALYPRAAGVVVQTESVAQWARAFCRHVHVIPNFVERPPLLATPGTDLGPKRLLAMGRLAPEKGFDLLVEAFGRIAERHPDWTLVILGDGPERERLEALVRGLGLQRRVLLPGRADEPGPHLASAHAFALPSLYEGFPNALLEAMACGLPAVAFDCRSGPSDIIDHGRSGLLVPVGDTDGLAAALDRLLGSPAERARLGQQALSIADRLAPERVLAQWSALLRPGGSR
jgi:GalNAc-alpha-(1->4)-GalNAc-alpha-(1->3)-diNAcBac-PP-undecaprenol alpha-1,4-N-acetyl-D-galactosaminyltransferase